MSNQDIDKFFVSIYDKFLFDFDAHHEKTLSQLWEIRKHQRIAFLRDNPNPDQRESEIWEDF